MLWLLERLPYFGHLKSEIADLKSPAEFISRQLRASAPRQAEQKKRTEAFLGKLEAARRKTST